MTLAAAHASRLDASRQNAAALEAAVAQAKANLYAALPAFRDFETACAAARRDCGLAEHAADDTLQAAHEAASPAERKAYADASATADAHAAATLEGA